MPVHLNEEMSLLYILYSPPSLSSLELLSKDHFQIRAKLTAGVDKTHWNRKQMKVLFKAWWCFERNYTIVTAMKVLALKAKRNSCLNDFVDLSLTTKLMCILTLHQLKNHIQTCPCKFLHILNPFFRDISSLACTLQMKYNTKYFSMTIRKSQIHWRTSLTINKVKILGKIFITYITKHLHIRFIFVLYVVSTVKRLLCSSTSAPTCEALLAYGKQQFDGVGVYNLFIL